LNRFSLSLCYDITHINSNIIKMEAIMTVSRLLLIIVLLFTLTACGGSDTEVRSTTMTTTMGQELMDLNESYKRGIINESEYNDAKEKIMERYDN